MSILAATVLSVSADAAGRGTRDLHGNVCQMIPPNTQSYSESLNSGIDEETFNKVIDLAEKVYKPIVAKKGGNLVVERRWTDNTVNAYASRSGKTWTVSMFGGLARHPETTPDAFAMVVCHEIGHHIGGAPKYSWANVAAGWASVEGQSDYFATLKCMRTVLAKVDNWRGIHRLYKPKDVPQVVTDRCKAGQGSSEQEFALCIRSSMGGLALARLLADLGRSKMPEFDTPDKTVVSRTMEGHPAAQCRLDTYFAGAVCPVGHDIEVSDTDETAGVCNLESGQSARSRADRIRLFANNVGVRSACWFKGGAPALRNRPLVENR